MTTTGGTAEELPEIKLLKACCFEVDGERRVRLSLTTANAEGQVKLAGDAVVAWP